MRDLIPPAAKLGVQIVDIDKRARRKEGVAQVLKREIAGYVASRRLMARKRSGGFSTCADPAGAGLFEIRQLGSRQPKPYRARCSWLTDDESAGLERLDHLMHDRWRDSEESLQIRFGRWPPVDLRVVVDVREILPLLRRERLRLADDRFGRAPSSVNVCSRFASRSYTASSTRRTRGSEQWYALAATWPARSSTSSSAS
jgi:hypothetical protein